MSASTPSEPAPGTVGGPGLLVPDGERATVTFHRMLPYPIEDVWTAITDPKELERWFMVKVSREPTTGRLEMWHSTGVRATGNVLVWDPPRVYEYEWMVEPEPALRSGEDSVVRFELSAVPGGTLLVLTHRKLSRRTAEVFANGLKSFLDRLAAQLGGAPLPMPGWLAATAPGWATRTPGR